MRPIATDTNDFPRLRRENCIYVDKTEYVHRLVSQPGSRLFFMSRPRRFGKSLTLSVLKALFSGRRELFDGLFIAEKTDWNWNETYPIIHFEFNDVTTMSLEAFEKNLANHVRARLEDAGYSYDGALSAHENFGNAIQSLSAKNGGKGVVILIDEYDAPVGHSLGDIDMAEKIRDRMSALYSRMKNRTGDIRFLLMTGISKFTRLSVFSQMREKGYAEPCRADARPIWLIGLSFDSKTRHLVDFAAVRYGGTETGITETRRSEDA